MERWKVGQKGELKWEGTGCLNSKAKRRTRPRVSYPMASLSVSDARWVRGSVGRPCRHIEAAGCRFQPRCPRGVQQGEARRGCNRSSKGVVVRAQAAAAAARSWCLRMAATASAAMAGATS